MHDIRKNAVAWGAMLACMLVSAVVVADDFDFGDDEVQDVDDIQSAGDEGDGASPLQQAPPSIESVEWGTDADRVRDGRLGALWGKPITYQLRTQYATLESSHALMYVRWYDRYQREEKKQILLYDTKAARMQDYDITFERASLTVRVAYNCPTRRGDRDTICTEFWAWQKNSREFELVRETSTNPVANSIGAIEELIRDGKLNQAKRSIDLLRERYGNERIPHDLLFEAYFDEMAERISKHWERGQPDKGLSALKGFIAKPPITSAESCPDYEMVVICLKGKKECGCSDAFGLLSVEPKRARQYWDIARTLSKLEEYELSVFMLTPIVARDPEYTKLTLALADAHWELGSYDKARKLYIQVRRIRMANKTYIPKRVFERFQA
ncbi:MAG: hypothetical protein AAGI01_13345, partial [Myxococcota bacterium]